MSMAGETRMVGKKIGTQGQRQPVTSLTLHCSTNQDMGKERGTGARGRVVRDVVIFLWVFPFNPGVLKAQLLTDNLTCGQYYKSLS